MKEEKAIRGCRDGGDAFEAGEFGGARRISDEPGFEAGGESSVPARGHVDQFALREEEEQADAEIGEHGEEDDFWEEGFGDDRGGRHGENDQIPNAKYQGIVDGEMSGVWEGSKWNGSLTNSAEGREV